MTFDVIIKFIDGETVVIKDASNYRISENCEFWVVVKNKRCCYFKKDFVKYIVEKGLLETENQKVGE